MAFNHMGITTAGYELIARATSGDLIDYIGGASSVNTITDVSHTSAPSYYQSLDGVIKSVSSNNYNARIVIEFSNALLQTAITLKSFAIKAKSVSSSEEVIFAACSVDNGGVTLQTPQETGGIIINFQIPFNIVFDGAASYIEGVEGGSASIGDLDRFVSLHRLGNSQAGENQTVYGLKTFVNGIDIAGEAHTQDIFPYENSNKIGADGNRFGSVWALSLNGAIPTASWGATNVYAAEYGAILCIKEESATLIERKPGDVFLAQTATSTKMCELDGTVTGTAPYGYYRCITHTDGTKPFLAIYLKALLEE